MTNEELCLLIQHGDNKKAYLEELYLNNKNHIAQIASRYRGYAEFEDLSQEGYFGLLKAAETYDDSLGTKFSTHAYQHIRACIHRYIETNSNTVRIPSGQRSLIMKMNRIIDDYRKKNSHKPSTDEIAELMGQSKSKVLQLIKDSLLLEIKSMNEPIFTDGESCCLGDNIEDKTDYYGKAIDGIQNDQLKAVLWDIVDNLEPLQSRVIHEKYEHELNNTDTGKMLNISSEKVKSIEARALNELRKPKYSNRLRSYNEERIYSIGVNHVGFRYFSNTWTSSTEKAALLIEGL